MVKKNFAIFLALVVALSSLGCAFVSSAQESENIFVNITEFSTRTDMATDSDMATDTDIDCESCRWFRLWTDIQDFFRVLFSFFTGFFSTLF